MFIWPGRRVMVLLLSGGKKTCCNPKYIPLNRCISYNTYIIYIPVYTHKHTKDKLGMKH